MKLLLLILLSVCCSATYAVSNTPVEYTTHHLSKDVKQQISSVSTFALQPKILPKEIHFDRYHTPQPRPGNLATFRDNNFALQSARIVEPDIFFVARYSYCRTIGSLLIFPQHYFW